MKNIYIYLSKMETYKLYKAFLYKITNFQKKKNKIKYSYNYILNYFSSSIFFFYDKAHKIIADSYQLMQHTNKMNN